MDTTRCGWALRGQLGRLLGRWPRGEIRGKADRFCGRVLLGGGVFGGIAARYSEGLVEWLSEFRFAADGAVQVLGPCEGVGLGGPLDIPVSQVPEEGRVLE